VETGLVMQKGTIMAHAVCPECDAEIVFAAGTVAGEIIVCPDCAAELEVISITPAVVELAPEVGEDWGE
jgi:alpha-aminoadipate carrier protein LysW